MRENMSSNAVSRRLFATSMAAKHCVRCVEKSTAIPLVHACAVREFTRSKQLVRHASVSVSLSLHTHATVGYAENITDATSSSPSMLLGTSMHECRTMRAKGFVKPTIVLKPSHCVRIISVRLSSASSRRSSENLPTMSTPIRRNWKLSTYLLYGFRRFISILALRRSRRAFILKLDMTCADMRCTAPTNAGIFTPKRARGFCTTILRTDASSLPVGAAVTCCSFLSSGSLNCAGWSYANCLTLAVPSNTPSSSACPGMPRNSSDTTPSVCHVYMALRSMWMRILSKSSSSFPELSSVLWYVSFVRVSKISATLPFDAISAGITMPICTTSRSMCALALYRCPPAEPSLGMRCNAGQSCPATSGACPVSIGNGPSLSRLQHENSATSLSSPKQSWRFGCR